MLELLFSKTSKEEKKRQLEENVDTIKPIYEVVKQGTFDCTPEEGTLVIWIILLICMIFMDFHIIPDTEPNSIMYAVIIFGMINSIVQILRKE